MNVYDFEGIKLNIPKDIEEMQSIMHILIDDNRSKYISFINPEIFLAQQRNAILHDYFCKSEYNFIDGIGLINAINKSQKTNYSYMNRFPGTDFFNYLPNEEIRVVFYGSKPGVAEKAKSYVEKQHQNIKIVYTIDGYTNKSDNDVVDLINSYSPDILIVCLGCPKQELFIKNNINKLDVKLVFGNGGSLDFWSGSVKRAPQWLIKMGFEWAYRLFQNFTFKRVLRQSKLGKFLFLYKFNRYNIKSVISE